MRRLGFRTTMSLGAAIVIVALVAIGCWWEWGPATPPKTVSQLSPPPAALVREYSLSNFGGEVQPVIPEVLLGERLTIIGSLKTPRDHWVKFTGIPRSAAEIRKLRSSVPKPNLRMTPRTYCWSFSGEKQVAFSVVPHRWTSEDTIEFAGEIRVPDRPGIYEVRLCLDEVSPVYGAGLDRSYLLDSRRVRVTSSSASRSATVGESNPPSNTGKAR